MLPRVAIRSATAALLLGSLALPASALDLVQTRDGKTLTGKIRLAPTGIILQDEKQSDTPIDWPAISNLRRDAITPPEAKGHGTGVKAEYFGDLDFKGLRALRTDPNVDFDWTGVSPAARVQTYAYSVRWTGRIEPRFTEKYTFSAASDGALRVWVKGVRVLSQRNGNDEHERIAIPLKAGELVEIRIEAVHWWGNTFDRLYWESPSQARQILPADRLYLPSGFSLEETEKYLFAQTDRGGLKAEHFEDADFKKLARTQLEGVAEWRGFDPPDPTLKTTGAIRWTGQILADRTDRYAFDLLYDWGRGARLWIDGKLLIDNWHKGNAAMGPSRRGGSINLQADKRYDIKLEVTDHLGDNRVQLDWKYSGNNGGWVPSDHLIPPADMPRVALVAPFHTRQVDQRDTIALKAFAEVAPGRITKVDFLDNGKLRGTAESAPYTFSLDHLDPDANHLVARAHSDSDGQTSSLPVTIWAEPHADLLGEPWRDHQVGEAGPPLKIEKTGNQLTLTAPKGDCFGEHDALRMLYRTLDAEGQITVKIDSLEAPAKKDLPKAPLVFAGLTVRDSLASTAYSMSLLVTPKSAWIIRRSSDSPTPESQEIAVSLPSWLRIVRERQQIRVYASKDGTTWERLGAQPIVWEGRSYVGLTAFSETESPGKVTFETPEITAGVPMLATTSGVQTRDGSFVAGQIVSVEPQNVVIARHGEPDRKFLTRDVAKVLFHALSADTANAGAAGKTGAILATGDFMEAQFQSFKDQHANFSSLEFGRTSIEANDLNAIVLQDLDPHRGKAQWRVETRDGSRLLAKDLQVKAESMSVSTLGGETFAVSNDTLRELTALEK